MMAHDDLVSEYIVATALKPRKKVTGEWIEELVQRRSRIESDGNAVFTLMLRRRFESKQEITENFVSQSDPCTSTKRIHARRYTRKCSGDGGIDWYRTKHGSSGNL